jgi:hypothetical protein
MTALLVVNLDEGLLREFKSHAALKHGRLRNALRPEVEQALKNYLELQKTGDPCESSSDYSKLGKTYEKKLGGGVQCGK